MADDASGPTNSTAFVLKGIEGMLGTDVKYFSMVRQEGERLYMCLGKRALFLLDFEPPFQDMFYYAHIKRVVIDTDNLLLFQVDLEGRQPLVLESFERERLCDELAICWKADFMYRNWRWQRFPLKRGRCDVAKPERTANEFTAAPPKMQQVVNRGYLLFIEEAFKQDPPGPDGLPSGRFRMAGRERELKVVVEPPAPVSALGRREKDDLRLAAEKIARSQSADSEMMALRSEQYHKKMNLMGDLASWACWAVHLRTPILDVGVIASRRKYVPAVCDMYQDVFVVQVDDVAPGAAGEFMQGLEKQADTLSPLVRIPYYDDTITRIKADALLYDEASCSWFHSLGVLSSNIDAARAFYKSVANLLHKEGEGDFDMGATEPETVLIEDPLRVVVALWEDAPGLKHDSARAAWRNWRRRVARFLCWAVDGGLHPGEMTLEMLVRCERKPKCTPRSRDILQRLFDFFVHMATDAAPYELDSSSMADRVGDADFMASFTMNVRPLVVLLDRGYMHRMLDDEVPPKYVLFLSQLLTRPFDELGTELLVSVCNQIALLSQSEFQRQALLNSGALLPLIESLRSDNDVLLLAVGKALINLSSGNLAATDAIVNEGGVRSLIPHLLNKSDELARALCVLLKNCLTAPELRERIVNDGAVGPIVKLLHRTEILGAQRSDEVVAAAAAAVWNVSAHDGARTIVRKERGVEALVMQLRESSSEAVWQKCAGCLMSMAANSDAVKHLVGEEMGVPALSQIVITKVGAGESLNGWKVPALKACLGALAVLSSDERNMATMRAEGLDQQVEKYLKVKDDKVAAFVKQLTERLFAQHAKD